MKLAFLILVLLMSTAVECQANHSNFGIVSSPANMTRSESIILDNDNDNDNNNNLVLKNNSHVRLIYQNWNININYNAGCERKRRSIKVK